MKKIIFFIAFGLTASLLQGQSLVNTKHLDHLYEQVVVNKDTIGIIHIYADYPNYNWIGDDDEGIACIDDAARAMIFYLGHYKITGEPASLDKTKKLLNFIFYMHAENGFFYNFIWPDYTINKEFRTSEAIPNWWSWRALWALAEAGSYFIEKEPSLYKRIDDHIKKLLSAAKPFLDKKEEYKDYSGLSQPAWLPYGSAADQAALITKSLTIYFKYAKDPSLLNIIKKLADGIIKMQQGDENTPPYYAFLSWENSWHAWGNSQAEALILAGEVLGDSSYLKAALNEIRNFYPFLLKKQFLSEFTIEKNKDGIKFNKVSQYPQIAYGISPLILNSVSAYEHTKDTFYIDIAAQIACWFLSCNLADVKMYTPRTGVCYDGISEGKVNKNSGAESTIEALFSFLKIEIIPELKSEFWNKVNND